MDDKELLIYLGLSVVFVVIVLLSIIVFSKDDDLKMNDNNKSESDLTFWRYLWWGDDRGS